VNEAFAVVPMTVMQELSIPHEKMNVLGGACALGHPVGASGARIVVTLLNALRRRGGKYGVAGICLAGGEATALAVELADFNIRVNCVAPGNTAVKERPTPRLARELTEQEKQWNQQFYDYVTKEGLFDRPASVEEQAAAIAFLASDDASYITGEVLDTGKRGMRISSVSH
jgi:NAD(P)-dependent dehydrogenase (short-subunit alcohol dehydrogenase family)